jgi:uncharacterized membrane protein
MLQTSIYVLGISLSLILIIAIFSRKKRSTVVKITLLIIGDVGLILTQLHYSDLIQSSLIILMILYGVLNILAIRKILLKENPRQEEFNRWHDNSDNWKAGIFYYNKADDRLMVPKRIEGMGWTINFANPYSIISFVVLIIAIIILGNIFK